VVSSTPRSLYPKGKSPCYPLDRRLAVFANMQALLKETFLFSKWLLYLGVLKLNKPDFIIHEGKK